VYGNGTRDRWAAMPSLADAKFIAKTVLRVAPAGRATDRPDPPVREADARRPVTSGAGAATSQTPGHHHAP
jgi:hypothetical protein